MSGLSFIWEQVLERIDAILAENKNESLAVYFENTELVELDENKAVVTTPFMFNSIVLNLAENSSIINSCFQSLLK